MKALCLSLPISITKEMFASSRDGMAVCHSGQWHLSVTCVIAVMASALTVTGSHLLMWSRPVFLRGCPTFIQQLRSVSYERWNRAAVCLFYYLAVKHFLGFNLRGSSQIRAVSSSMPCSVKPRTFPSLPLPLATEATWRRPVTRSILQRYRRR